MNNNKYQASETRYGNMTYVNCGASGLRLPRVSLGLWHNFGDGDPADCMKEMLLGAFDLGITHFDLANNYGHPANGSAERNFGKVLSEQLSAYRDEMIISTKAGYTMWPGPYGDGGSRKYLIASLDQSLRRMGLDYVDIFYHHRMTPDTPLEETMLALSQIVRSGKALYIGLSNYDGPTMQKASAILDELKVPFIINQNAYNILNRTPEQNGLLSTAKAGGKGVICFSPLAQGLLTDRYLHGIPADSRAAKNRFLKSSNITPELMQKIAGLREIARSRGETLSQMALAWVLHNEAVTSVLIGASSLKQIRENCDCIKSTPFTAEQLTAIDAAAK